MRPLVLVALVGCSNDATTAPPEDAGATDHARADAAIADGASTDDVAARDAPTDVDAPLRVNGCTTFVDRTADAGARVIAWTYTVATDPARCMEIKVGQSVTWSGDFVQHPLLAQGGDAPNPIADAGATGLVAFPAEGTFGFACANHPFMTGAIQVGP